MEAHQGGDDIGMTGPSSTRTHEVVIDLSLTGLVNDLTSPEPLLTPQTETSYSFVPSLEQGERERESPPPIEEVVEGYGDDRAGEERRNRNNVTECSFVNHAFTIDATDEATLLERVGQKCSVPMSDLDLYELRPLRTSGGSQNNALLHIGIRVRNAGENARGGVLLSSPLQQQQQKEEREEDKKAATGTSLIGVREADHSLESEIIREHAELIAEKTIEARRWESKAKEMSQSNQKFKSQTQNLQRLLAKSEMMWRKGQDALDTLKSDFKSLSVDIKDNEKLLWKKFDLISPDKRLEYLNAPTRKELGSKNLGTLVKLLENSAALDVIEKLTSEPSLLNRIEDATRFQSPTREFYSER